MFLAIEVRLLRSSARMPRTNTPEALKGEDASAWPSTTGAASRMPCDLADALGDVLPVGQRRFQRLHQKMPVEAEDLVQQFLAEAVHHRHHDDQRGDAEHDAEERKPGDDGDEAFLATRPQIASGQQPFEGRKRWGSNWLAHGFIHSSIFP